MAVFVDTNILLYAVNRACPKNELCLDFLRGVPTTGDTCFVPENIIYEFLRVATHPRVFPQPVLRTRLAFWMHYFQFRISEFSARRKGIGAACAPW